MLLKAAEEKISGSEISLNASLNSETFYRSFGFRPTGPVSDINGVRFQPMVKEITR